MNFIQTVEADATKALAEVKAGLTYLEAEGEKIISWVEKEVPGSAGAIASFLQGAEADAADLARVAASGLSTQISTSGDAMQTLLLNLIQSSGMAQNAQGQLKSIDVSAVALLKKVAQGLVTTGLAQLLAKLAPST